MKKLISMLFILIMLFALASNVFAGSIPEDSLYMDNCKVFIGTIENYKKTYIKLDCATYPTMTIRTCERIKGNVVVGESITYKGYSSGKRLKKNTYYLFTCFDDNNLNIFEIEEKKGNQIKLYNPEENDLIQRLEDYINNGDYAEAEALRLSKMTDEEIAALGENNTVAIEKKPDFNYGYLIPIAAAVIISGVTVALAIKKRKTK